MISLFGSMETENTERIEIAYRLFEICRLEPNEISCTLYYPSYVI